jgi:AbiV family abortive infection protein
MKTPNLSAMLAARPFTGKLFPEHASQAINAAIECACEHLTTAELLFESKRFAHCVSASILAIEEAGKMPLIMDIFLSDQPAARWKEYSSHPAKTRHLNYGVTLRVKIQFPDAPPGFAEYIGDAGPPPEILEKTKQRAIYSDCLTIKGKCHIHDPADVDWKEIAKHLLDDARAFVRSLRPKSAAELSIWLKHAKICQKEGRALDTELAALEQSLRQAGFIKEGWWKTILAESGQIPLP